MVHSIQPSVTFFFVLEAFNFALKAIIQEPRPKTPVTQGTFNFVYTRNHLLQGKQAMECLLLIPNSCGISLVSF
jgi:hypothetical protein